MCVAQKEHSSDGSVRDQLLTHSTKVKTHSVMWLYTIMEGEGFCVKFEEIMKTSFHDKDKVFCSA